MKGLSSPITFYSRVRLVWWFNLELESKLDWPFHMCNHIKQVLFSIFDLKHFIKCLFCSIWVCNHVKLVWFLNLWLESKLDWQIHMCSHVGQGLFQFVTENITKGLCPIRLCNHVRKFFHSIYGLKPWSNKLDGVIKVCSHIW
jgi:hypothetical protein